MADQGDLNSEFKKTIEEGMGANFVEFPPLTRELPKDIDLDKFPERDRKLVADAIISSTSFIHAPLIVDNYEDHNERENKRIQLVSVIREKYGKEQSETFNTITANNKLKRNSIAMLDMAASLWEMVAGESQPATHIHSVVKREVSIILPDNFDVTKRETLTPVDPWKTKSLNEKKVVLTDLTNAAIDMLWEISDK